MVSRSDVPGPWSTLALLGGASAVGLLAGSRPLLSVAVALGLLYAVVSLLDVRVGLCLFTVVTFLEVLPTPAVSLTKIAGLVLGLAWLARDDCGPSPASARARGDPSGCRLAARRAPGLGRCKHGVGAVSWRGDRRAQQVRAQRRPVRDRLQRGPHATRPRMVVPRSSPEPGCPPRMG